jgi:hypothetical protein
MWHLSLSRVIYLECVLISCLEIIIKWEGLYVYAHNFFDLNMLQYTNILFYTLHLYKKKRMSYYTNIKNT